MVFLILQTQPNEGYYRYPFAAFKNYAEAAKCRDHYNDKYGEDSIYEIKDNSIDAARNNGGNEEIPLWESFEQYTNTILPRE